MTSIGGTELNSPVDSLERTGRPRRSGSDRQCMALSDSSLLCSGKLMFSLHPLQPAEGCFALPLERPRLE